MSQAHADFAIVGSTPLARLVAGLLASAHGKKVVFAGESQSGYRLPRGVDLSAAPTTRPDTWSLLKALVPETLKLVTHLGGRATRSRVAPILFAEQAAGQEALAHIRQMALAFGHGADPITAKAIGAGREGLILRDVVALHRPMLETALDGWLVQHQVRRVSEGETLGIRLDGSAELAHADGSIAIGQTVLADDMALLHHLPVAQWPGLLQRQIASTVFTEPTRPIAARVMLQLDSGLTMMQQPGRGIIAMGPGRIDPFMARLGTLLGREREYRQAGQSSYERVCTGDGGPAVGRLDGTGVDVLAGLGPTGAFFAPAIARWLSGAASPSENAWFSARLVNRSTTASAASEVAVTG